ncbi:MAG: hypothetical protein KAI67_03640 [Candidatus Pacebacteria bacterium]|nr:hypothetical protein [Candidatus Paceibacterota bacterium]
MNELSEPDNDFHGWGKPVIYLYPQQKQDVYVNLEHKGKFIATYPEYDYEIKGWEVTAYPDGKIINNADNREYSYLFWEGESYDGIEYDFSKGFVIEGKDTVEFLQKKLEQIGLTPKEYNEFIVYWYPKMKDNKFNYVYFAGSEYTDTAVLNITPEPDSILRVFMIFKSLEEKIEIQSQDLKPFERKGFVVVEWGGTEIE